MGANIIPVPFIFNQPAMTDLSSFAVTRKWPALHPVMQRGLLAPHRA